MLKTEVEMCPHCEHENEFRLDVEKYGYQTVCSNCGKELMLCDACMHSEDNESMYCDWSEEYNCFRAPK